MIAVDADAEGVVADLYSVIDLKAFSVNDMGLLFLHKFGDEPIDSTGWELLVHAIKNGLSTAEDLVDAVALGCGCEDDGGLWDEEEFFSDGFDEGLTEVGFGFVAFDGFFVELLHGKVPFIDDDDESAAEFDSVAGDFFIELGDPCKGVEDEEDDVGAFDGFACTEA